MGGCYVGLRELQVGIDHCEGGMPEDALQGKDITAVAQEFDGEGVAEAVRVAIPHAGKVAYFI